MGPFAIFGGLFVFECPCVYGSPSFAYINGLFTTAALEFVDAFAFTGGAGGRGWFWAFRWSGGVVSGGFWVGRDLGGMGRANRTQCSWSGVVLGVWVVVRGGLGWFWGR